MIEEAQPPRTDLSKTIAPKKIEKVTLDYIERWRFGRVSISLSLIDVENESASNDDDLRIPIHDSNRSRDR